ncbi:hypothetical protein [Marinicella rhabdoformis]|uniref:hypothetical protein n=1 Tax=Marinicella rhabdoformis TaxID=2580566 RepID=UPI0012AECC84|nr:hypothetical protein [Marinicella rhabdoformis]
MKAVIFIVLWFFGFSNSNAQPWKPLKGVLCPLVGYPSITLQQVDAKGVEVPFDCKNIDVKVFEGKKLVNHIKPGFHFMCDRITNKKTRIHSRIMPIGVWGCTEGIYDVVVEKSGNIQRFSEIRINKSVDDPCRLVPVQLTVK